LLEFLWGIRLAGALVCLSGSELAKELHSELWLYKDCEQPGLQDVISAPMNLQDRSYRKHNDCMMSVHVMPGT
jgi:hypothetical protein